MARASCDSPWARARTRAAWSPAPSGVVPTPGPLPPDRSGRLRLPRAPASAGGGPSRARAARARRAGPRGRGSARRVPAQRLGDDGLESRRELGGGQALRVGALVADAEHDPGDGVGGEGLVGGQELVEDRPHRELVAPRVGPLPFDELGRAVVDAPETLALFPVLVELERGHAEVEELDHSRPGSRGCRPASGPRGRGPRDARGAAPRRPGAARRWSIPRGRAGRCGSPARGPHPPRAPWPRRDAPGAPRPPPRARGWDGRGRSRAAPRGGTARARQGSGRASRPRASRPPVPLGRDPAPRRRSRPGRGSRPGEARSAQPSPRGCPWPFGRGF